MKAGGGIYPGCLCLIVGGVRPDTRGKVVTALRFVGSVDGTSWCGTYQRWDALWEIDLQTSPDSAVSWCEARDLRPLTPPPGTEVTDNGNRVPSSTETPKQIDKVTP